MGHRLSVMPETLAICRFAPDVDLPPWATTGAFFSVTRTADELSIVAEQDRVPAGVSAQGPWRAFKVDGPIPFQTVGVLASLAGPLADAGISLLAVSTFDTDYLLVPSDRFEAARAALARAGHTMA